MKISALAVAVVDDWEAEDGSASIVDDFVQLESGLCYLVFDLISGLDIDIVQSQLDGPSLVVGEFFGCGFAELLLLLLLLFLEQDRLVLVVPVVFTFDLVSRDDLLLDVLPSRGSPLASQGFAKL